MGKKVEFKVCGLSAKYFVPLFLVIIICTYGGFMPTVKIGETTGVGMVGTLAFLMSVGGLFFWLGNSIPVVNSYLGGSVLFCMFGPALLNYFGLLPETTVKGVSILMKYGLQDVYIAALLCGSVLYMDRKILLGAISRYLPAILGSQVFALGFCFLGGLITGYGPLNAVFDIGAPTMSGGSGGALVTIPTLYTDLSGTDWMSMSGMFLCYVSLSNVVAILLFPNRSLKKWVWYLLKIIRASFVEQALCRQRHLSSFRLSVLILPKSAAVSLSALASIC